MNFDAILSFAGALLSAVMGSGLIHLPAEASTFFQDATKILVMLGTSLHLDGK